jgi:hypothetical protein
VTESILNVELKVSSRVKENADVENPITANSKKYFFIITPYFNNQY